MALTKDPLALSPEQLDALEPAQIHGIALQAAGCVLRGRLLMGRCLLSMHRTEAYLRYGCSSVIHYAKAWLGCKEDEAYDIRLVALRLENLPVLTEAAETGQIGWCALRAVLRRATPETEAEYLQMAQNNTVGRLEWLLSKEATDSPEQSADLVRLMFYVQPDVIEMYQSAVRKISRGMGCRVDPAKILECLLAEFHAGHLEPGGLPEEAPPQAPWEAVDGQETPCPRNPNVTLVSGTRINFNPQSRHVTEAQRDLLLRRDRYRCSTPDCPNYLWLHMHHIVFYCEGGATVPDNLVTVCSACHGNIHDGNLLLEGIAPAGLTWSTSAGRALGSMPQQSAEQWDSEWLDTG